MCNKIIKLEGLVLSARAHFVHEGSAIPGDLTAHSASEERTIPSDNLRQTERRT